MRRVRRWVLMRHGERSPLTARYRSVGVTDEAALWRGLVAAPDPAQGHGANGAAQAAQVVTDAEKWPFCALTGLGVSSARAFGRRLAMEGPVRRVRARSTVYGRTTMTLDETLKGLLLKDGGVDAVAKVVVVQNRVIDAALNGYDAAPEAVRAAMRDAEATADFQALLRESTDLAAFLEATIPATTTTTTTTTEGAPFFSWLEAVDYVDARLAHGVPVPRDLLAVAGDARRVLARRYATRATHRPLANLIARPLVAEVLDWLLEEEDGESDPAGDLVLLVAHDSTLLALWNALGGPNDYLPNFCASLHLTVDADDQTVTCKADGEADVTATLFFPPPKGRPTPPTANTDHSKTRLLHRDTLASLLRALLDRDAQRIES